MRFWTPVAAGQVYLGAPDLLHRWRTREQPGVIFGFILKAETAPGDDTAAAAGNWLARATHAIGFGYPAPASANVLLGLLNADLQREDGFLPVATAPLLAAFCHALLRPVVELAHSRRDLNPLPGRSRSERLFRQAVGFLEINLGNPVDLTTVARYVNLGPRQLNRIFVEQTGAPAGAYLRERRLVRARELLHDGTFRVKEVATACGFTEPAYFCRMFRRRFGASPARFHGQP